MTRVDFYILPQDSIEQRHLFACRLTEKARKLGHRVYIHSDDNAQAKALDELLWSWRASSFIPHRLEQDSSDDSHCDVLIGYGDGNGEAAAYSDLLINLSTQVPAFFGRFQRVSEIVVQQAAITSATRENFRFYRDRGYPMNTHQLAN